MLKPIEILPTTMQTGTYSWSWCYLHGEAENIYSYDGFRAPDIFMADTPKPTQPGVYLCNINGHRALAVLDMHNGVLGGRVALLTDTDALLHVTFPALWC